MCVNTCSFGVISVRVLFPAFGGQYLTTCEATKLAIGASVALPAATMCVCRNLELVASGRIARLTREDKQKKMYFDLAMCYGLPLIIMALRMC